MIQCEWCESAISISADLLSGLYNRKSQIRVGSFSTAPLHSAPQIGKVAPET